MYTMAKRIFLFIITNLLILTTLFITWTIISSLFGLQGRGYGTIFVMYSVIGMGGALISLWMSKFVAKMAMGVRVIDPKTSDPQLRRLLETVYSLARASGLGRLPEVGIYDSPEMNAFATGPSKNNALVAVSTGLLRRMDRDQVEGVLGHEVAHIANGDMVTMTLLQGVVNVIVLFLARLLASIIASQSDDRNRPAVEFGVVILLQIVFSILGSMVINAFSRWREYRADAGGARLAGRDRMISALRALAGNQVLNEREEDLVSTLKISRSPRRQTLALLFSSHPPIEDRIRRLQQAG